MPAFKIRSVDEVPPMPPASSGKQLQNQRMYDDFIRQVDKEHVGIITLEEGDTLRGVKMSLTRAAKRLNRKIETWGNDQVFYRHSRK